MLDFPFHNITNFITRLIFAKEDNLTVIDLLGGVFISIVDKNGSLEVGPLCRASLSVMVFWLPNRKEAT